MTDGPKRGGLGRFVRAGREQGARLKRGDALVSANSSTTLEDVAARLDEAENYAKRGELMDREWVLTIVRGVVQTLEDLDDPRADELRLRADRIGADVVRVEESIFVPLREAVRSGEYDADRWRATVKAMTPLERNAYTQRLFGLYNPPRASHAREPDMVHFVASSVDHIVEVAARVSPADVFYDIGSGTGLVALLVRWLTGATVRGVEYDPVYVERANEAKAVLGIDVTFVAADARAVTYDDATVLYLFEPFRGAVMASFLERVRERPARLFWRFVVQDEFAAVDWLECVERTPSGLFVYRTTDV